MKTHKLIFGLLSVILLLNTGCESNDDTVFEYRTNDVLYQKNAKLKRISLVFSNNSLNEFANYEYDEQGRIYKVNTPTANAYNLYEYNEKSQLIHILTYMSNYMSNYDNPTTYVLSRTVVYTYDENGNKIKEWIDGGYTYDVNENNSTKLIVYTLFEYENNKLIKSEHYTENKLDLYTSYEYNALGEIAKEYFSVPNVEEEPIITEHTYKEGLLVYSTTYSNEKTIFMWDSRKIYDKNDNLITTIDNNPGLSSSSTATAFYVTRRYEYYE